MPLNFQRTLPEALAAIGCATPAQEFIIHAETVELPTLIPDDIFHRYAEAKWDIVELINQRYSTLLSQPFDLYNWLYAYEPDELAYFLNETSSNCFNYSQFKAPSKFKVWLGSKGFIVAVEQRGNGFNAESVNQTQQKENEGAAFYFFRTAKSTVFFDDSKNATIVYFEWCF